jgi:hypothetical protein
MRRLLSIAALTALVGGLAACSPLEPAHDVAYYRDHPADRAAKMTACHNDRGKIAATPDCINALAADSEATSEKFWTVPKTAPRVQDPGKL